jgi:hypothetical protein
MARREILKLKTRPVDFESGTYGEAWRAVAGDLLATARLVWQSISDGMAGYRATRGRPRTGAEIKALELKVRHRGSFFLLAGLAIENQLKGVIVQREIAEGRAPLNSHDVLSLFPKKQHDLVRLAERAKVEIGPYGKMLARLSCFVQWAGRYPIPKKEIEARFDRTTRETDLEDIEAFFARVDGEFRRLRSPNHSA